MDAVESSIVGVRPSGGRGGATGVRLGRRDAILTRLADGGGAFEIIAPGGTLSAATVAARAGGFLVLRAGDGQPIRRAHTAPVVDTHVSILRFGESGGVESGSGAVVRVLDDGLIVVATEARPPGWEGAIIVADGRVAGVVESEAEMDGRADLTIRPVAQLDALLLRALDPAGPVGWVRVGGSTSPPEEQLEIARTIGAELHRHGLGLIHGGGEGIDLAARAGFVAAGGSALRLIGKPEWGPPELALEEGEVVSGIDSAVPEASFYGDALVLFDGLDGAGQMSKAARGLGLPVLPMVGNPEGTAAELQRALFHSWPALAVAGVTKDDYGKLGPSFDPAALGRILAALARQIGGVQNMKPAPWLADLPSSSDLLGVRPQVTRMAEAIVAEDARLPIAIGLLGPWGSGKSSFIEMLKDDIESLSGASCGRVCQVPFNAWQYVDTDIWASLAARLFEVMWAELEPGSTPEAQRQKLGTELDSARKKHKTEVDATSAAETKLAEKRQALQEATEQHASLASLTEAEALRALRDTDELRALAKEVGESLKKSGVRLTDGATLDEIRAVAALVRSTPALVQSLLGPLSRGEQVVLGALLLFPLVAFVASFFIPVSAGALSVPELFAGALVVLRRARAPLEQMQKVGDELVRMRARAREITTQKLASLSADQVTASEGVATAEADARAAEKRLADTRSQIATIEAKLAELDAGKLVHDLIRSRGGESSVYRTGEGMVARLRRDLDVLTRMLADQRLAYAKAAKKPDVAPISRIVLYIDDLDRCPSGKVVRVLEAVQLLLAVDLFVVVVAVDPRWLSRSLEHEYTQLLGAARGAAAAKVSAFEYLEKIFQIPYSLAPANKDGFAAMLGASLPLARPALEQPPPGREVKGEEKGSGQPPGGVSSSGVTVVEPGEPAPPVPFEVGAAEQAFALRLWTMVDSPRAITRFVNVYRIVRPRASDPDHRAFVREDHRIAQVLLATLIGYPLAGTALLRHLIASKERPLPQGWSGLGDGVPEPADDQLKVEHGRMLLALDRFRGQLPADPERLASWARRVGPYSFHWSWE